MTDKLFKLNSNYKPSGDQPAAIRELALGLENNKDNQILLGVTGSGKTFTMAHTIYETQRPAVIMAHNKILAAQLYSEMKAFFPENAVEYFISYFDYYQPEAYVPSSDTYIDKDSVINSKLEQMKLSSIYSLLERKDCIIVCSVSSIYGIQSKEHYQNSELNLMLNQKISIKNLALRLTEMQYDRNDLELTRSCFRVRGDIVEIFPAHYEDIAVRLSFFDDEIERITSFDTLTNKKIAELDSLKLYASYLFATPKNIIKQAIPKIEQELTERVEFFTKNEKFIEAQRIQERTKFDIEMLESTGHCKGIEHYTKYLNNLKEGEPPSTLFDYLLPNTILFVDESHVSIPQIKAMYKGDYSRKSTLAEYGFRLPSCVANRPLKFEEWDSKRPNTIFVSATPGDHELELTSGEVVEQIIRPTGLLDPLCVVKNSEHQLDDLMQEIQLVNASKGKVLAVTLTKKMAMRVTDYLNENGIRAKYLHSDIDTFERVEIIKDLRTDKFDVLVGINLLREGLDIPECKLVAILDADKEGFLRSRTSLIQTIGRAARNSEGRVILYANTITKSMEAALSETERRRAIQEEYNKQHNITPTTVTSSVAKFDDIYLQDDTNINSKKDKQLDVHSVSDLQKLRINTDKAMRKAAKNLEFETALELREQIKIIDEQILKLS
ncbi:excinuclease ABC subunit UvrB [Rickettsiales bacterium LUAb2]